ncbi:MAG: hypothetical protein WBK20_05780 [Spirochaetota bacterium]
MPTITLNSPNELVVTDACTSCHIIPERESDCIVSRTGSNWFDIASPEALRAMA